MFSIFTHVMKPVFDTNGEPLLLVDIQSKLLLLLLLFSFLLLLLLVVLLYIRPNLNSATGHLTVISGNRNKAGVDQY